MEFAASFCFCRGNQRAIVGNLLNPADIFSPVYQIAVGNFESAAIATELKFFDRALLTIPDGTGGEGITPPLCRGIRAFEGIRRRYSTWISRWRRSTIPGRVSPTSKLKVTISVEIRSSQVFWEPSTIPTVSLSTNFLMVFVGNDLAAGILCKTFFPSF